MTAPIPYRKGGTAVSPSSRPDPGQLEALLRQCAQRLGTTPQALKEAAQRGDLSHLVQGPESRALQKVLADPQAAQKLLSTPQAQKLLGLLSNPPGQGK